VLEVVDQSQHNTQGPADQSENIALFRKRGFIETRTEHRDRQTGKRGAAIM